MPILSEVALYNIGVYYCIKNNLGDRDIIQGSGVRYPPCTESKCHEVGRDFRFSVMRVRTELHLASCRLPCLVSLLLLVRGRWVGAGGSGHGHSQRSEPCCTASIRTVTM